MWPGIYPLPKGSGADASVRRRMRSVFSVPITMHRLGKGGVRTSRGMSLDIGEEGLGAIVQDNLLIGERVAIDLRLRELLLSTVAIVRHTSGMRSGFEFLGLTAQERVRITSVMGSSKGA